jgi:hypothetical protein
LCDLIAQIEDDPNFTPTDEVTTQIAEWILDAGDSRFWQSQIRSNGDDRLNLYIIIFSEQQFFPHRDSELNLDWGRSQLLPVIVDGLCEGQADVCGLPRRRWRSIAQFRIELHGFWAQAFAFELAEKVVGGDERPSM